MNLRDLRNLESKEKRKINRASAMRKFGAAMGVVAATGYSSKNFLLPQSRERKRTKIYLNAMHIIENHQGIRL